jgi:hypothetical protein
MGARAIASPAGIEPTGDCYRSAAEHLLNMPASGWVLVHGRPTRSIAPFCQYGHAWLQLGEHVVFDTERQMLIPRSVYYRVGRIDPALCIKYAQIDVQRMLLEHEHRGPWEGVDAVPTVRR